MRRQTTKCQELLDEVSSSLAPFVTWVNSQAAAADEPVQLSLNAEQLPIFLALHPRQEEKTICLYHGSVQQAQLLHAATLAWQSALDVKTYWHFLPDALAEQESSGVIASSLSQTYHHLLDPAAAGNFLLPSHLAGLEIPAPDAYAAAHLTLHAGESRSQRDVLEQLIAAGYVRTDAAPEPGCFRLQGDQLTVRPPAAPPVAITWHGRDIETIIRHAPRAFADTDTRGDERRPARRQLSRLTLSPAAFPARTVPLARLLAHSRLIRPAHLSQLSARHTAVYDALRGQREFPLRPVANPIAALQAQPPIILAENFDRTRIFCRQHAIVAPTLCTHPLARYPFVLAGASRTVATEAALLPPLKEPKALAKEAGLALVAALAIGKPAVHADHGIGIFEGLAARTIGEQTREYLILRYAAGDTLSVPVEYAYKVTAYLGDHQPPLHRLGSPVWSRAKQRAAHDAQRFARELLAIAARRQESERARYRIGLAVDAQLAATFPFELTADQAAAWQDICQDLTGSRPMDRLIVGDVGFGKTELAVRAAKHVMQNGRQVAILAPTTLLVQQHVDTFRARLAEDAPRIAHLSRFASPAERTAAKEGIASGQVAIAIGTHALLSPSLAWHNLGLVVIDEEQRFGVRHKELLKKLRASLDVLSLSATPIPRTLSQALTGLKSLSVIATPPPGRQDIATRVARDSDEIITQALSEELARGGQAYVVTPRVQELPATAQRIAQLVPQARIAVAHGQLPDEQLAAAMQQFDTGQADVLVSSSIIESGLDIPRANTLIVLRATLFGLADLYQLRGRVGRREQQGVACFLYTQGNLTDLQQQRLAALTEATRLGSGWSLAQRDLEIRGAGNLLGREQAGSVSTVGVQLYLDLVRDAAAAPAPGSVDRGAVDIQLPLTAAIPPHYLADAASRADYYQRLSRARTPAEVDSVIDRLARIFGPPPEELMNLAALLRLQHAAAQAGVTAITAPYITPPQETPHIRLTVAAQDLPGTLKKLAPLGNWHIVNETARLQCPALTRQLVDRLTAALSRR